MTIWLCSMILPEGNVLLHSRGCSHRILSSTDKPGERLFIYLEITDFSLNQLHVADKQQRSVILLEQIIMFLPSKIILRKKFSLATYPWRPMLHCKS